MNIFALDLDTDKCAQYHTDKHVVKMILETAWTNRDKPKWVA